MKYMKLKDSWSKDYVLEVQSHSHLNPLKFQEDGSISMIHQLFGIVIISYIVTTHKHGWNDFRSLTIIKTCGKLEAIIHKSSLISPRDVLKH